MESQDKDKATIRGKTWRGENEQDLVYMKTLIYNKGVVARFEYPCEKTEVTVDGKALYVKYTYADKALAAGNRRRREKEVDDYFNDECGFVNLASIGIEKAVCEVR